MICPDGTYETRHGSQECQACPEGFYCQKSKRIDCVDGYCPSGSSAPVACPEGYHSNGNTKLTNEKECAYCPAGKYCSKGKIAGPCAAGYYCDFGAALRAQEGFSKTAEIKVVSKSLELQILFIIDLSVSMTEYRDSVADTIKSVVDGVSKNNEGAKFSVGLLGYYDLATCKSRSENKVVNFSDNIQFIGEELKKLPIGCEGNFDVAEDLN